MLTLIQCSDYIKKNYTKKRIDAMIQDEIFECADCYYFEVDGYESEAAWYAECGNGEAEQAVREELIYEISRRFNLNDPDFMNTNNFQLFNQFTEFLKDEYGMRMNNGIADNWEKQKQDQRIPPGIFL